MARDIERHLLPPHTHTPDEVSWDPGIDPNDTATVGQVMSVHDRTTFAHRRIADLEKMQRRQASLIVLALIFGALSVMAYRQHKKEHTHDG